MLQRGQRQMELAGAEDQSVVHKLLGGGELGLRRAS